MSERISFDQIPSVSNQPEQLPEPKTGKAQKRVHIINLGLPDERLRLGAHVRAAS